MDLTHRFKARTARGRQTCLGYFGPPGSTCRSQHVGESFQGHVGKPGWGGNSIIGFTQQSHTPRPFVLGQAFSWRWGGLKIGRTWFQVLRNHMLKVAWREIQWLSLRVTHDLLNMYTYGLLGLGRMDIKQRVRKKPFQKEVALKSTSVSKRWNEVLPKRMVVLFAEVEVMKSVKPIIF